MTNRGIERGSVKDWGLLSPHPVGVLQVRAVQGVEHAHVGLLQRHHLALDLQRRVAHVQRAVALPALGRVRRVAHVGLDAVQRRRSEERRDGVRHCVLLRQPSAARQRDKEVRRDKKKKGEEVSGKKISGERGRGQNDRKRKAQAAIGS